MITDRIADMIEAELATYVTEPDIDFDVSIQAVTVGFSQSPLGPPQPMTQTMGLVVFTMPALNPIGAVVWWQHIAPQFTDLLAAPYVHGMVVAAVEALRNERAKGIAITNGHK